MTEVGAFVAVVAMAATTYITRVLGVLIMSRVPLRPGVRRFLAALSGSVLVALVVPPVVTGDLAAQGAVLGAIIVMVVKRNSLLAMTVGVAIAIAVRAAGL